MWTARDLLPRGALGDLAVRLPGERYLGPSRRAAGRGHRARAGARLLVQHAGGELRASIGFKLVLTVWETIPMLDAYRNMRTRALPRADARARRTCSCATTERAREALLLEGVARGAHPRVPAGDRHGPLRRGRARGSGRTLAVILSPARLVWEKGHQDVLRALALLRRGTAAQPARDVRLLIVGSGPERARLQAYAGELGCRRRGRVARLHPLRGDAARVRARLVRGAGEPADVVVGGAVRHGAGRGDGGGVRRSSRAARARSRRLRARRRGTSRPATGWGSRRRCARRSPRRRRQTRSARPERRRSATRRARRPSVWRRPTRRRSAAEGAV